MRAHGITRWWRPIALLVLAGVALTALWAAHAHRHPAAPAGSAAAQVAISARVSGELSRLSAQAQSVISSTVGAADTRFAPTRRTAGYRLAGGGVTAALGRGGVSVDGDGARLALGLLAVGRPGRMRQLAEVTPTVRAQRVVYTRGRGVREWYAAGPLGVEQGFTVARRPPGRSGAVTLALAVGGLRARLRGSGVGFVARSGRVALRYGGLVARDARGRRLRAWLSLSHSRLLLKVADRGARYPLLIDPFIQQGTKLAPTDESVPSFGASVAVSTDGNTALIGAPEDNGAAGAAWVFTRQGSTWTQQGPKLTASDESGQGSFGSSVALSGDGDTALIGAHDDNGVGAAWVFTRSGSTWTQQGPKLTATGQQGRFLRFGFSVALSGDGTTALIGGPDDNTNVGAAWVFTRQGGTWTQQGPKLTATDESGQGSFGSSVALSGDGTTALIGAPFDNTNVGAAWVFTRSVSTWTQQGPKLTASDGQGPLFFGDSVAVSTDGNTALIGAPFDNGAAGAAWVFTRSVSTWTQQGPKLTATDESGPGGFGSSVALSGDGTTALIGAPDDNASVGAAWVFTLQESTSTQQGPKLTASDESGQGRFGSSVALSGDATTALIGAPNSNGGPAAAWVFARGQYLYWDNPQLGPCSGNQGCPSIGRGTVDGNLANINQNFITGIPGTSHVGVAVDRQHIYWASAFGDLIGRANLDGSGVNQQFIPSTSSSSQDLGAISLAVDDRYIYWAGTERDVSTAASAPYIGRANLDGSGVEKQFVHVPGGALSVAVDSSHIYWTDPNDNRIGRANLDGTGVNPSFITGVVNPQAVAVDGQHIYWTQFEGTSRPYGGSIGRANLDGSGVNPSFITGASEPSGVAVDYGHIYWANYYDCSNDVTQSGCDGGTIGRANLDGSGVDQSFITADHELGFGCDIEDRERCGPSSVAVGAPTQPECLRASTTPAPPPGGAVFAGPLSRGNSDANVVVIPAGLSWTGPASCAGIAQGSAQVMTHPSTISVAPDAAVLLRDQPAGLISAWGARNVAAGDPAPGLFPGRSDWQTTEADLITPQQLFDSYHGCPDCALPNNFQLTPGQPSASVAYQDDLDGAVLNGATLSGNLDGWDFAGAQLGGATVDGTEVSGANFDGADLRGATVDGAEVSGANFDDADLRGAQLSSLQFTAPPSFANVRVGALNGACTQFTDTTLVGFGLTPVRADLLVPGCETTPFLTDSTAPLALLHLMTVTDGASIDYANARFLVTAADHAVLAKADLSGVNLAGASFLGFPADLEQTKFNGASLQGTSFQLADLANAQFQSAVAPGASFDDANLTHATFAQATQSSPVTNLQKATFVDADVSRASFQSDDLSGAQFNDALAVDTDFNSVTATDTSFHGAHIYGDGEAFNQATDLTGANFVDAVLAGSEDGAGGFNLNDADLTDARFDDAQCIACNFTGATLNEVSFADAFLPGAQLSSVTSLLNASFTGAWLYCGSDASGNPSDANCTPRGSTQPQWPLALGSQESYGPVPFTTTTLSQGPFTDVTACPSGTPPSAARGCQGQLLPAGALKLPAACTAVALDACATQTSTLFDATQVNNGAPISLVPAVPPTWSSALSAVTRPGYYVGLTDGTVRQVGFFADPADNEIVAGTPGVHCTSAADACGDGGAATKALVGRPEGLAIGLDGSLYIADPVLHRVRRIDPSGTITTVAGSGASCSTPTAACGDGGPATAAALSGPSGVWAAPGGELFIADGVRGIREVLPDGTITTIGPKPGSYDVVSVAGDADGNLYAATNTSTATGSLAPTNNADYLIQVNIASGQVTPVVGTGTSGYNGNTDPDLGTLLPGTQVQINQPEGLSVALNGDVIFADAGNNLIRAYVPSTGNVIDDLGGLVSGGAPQGGFNGDGQFANQTEFANPAAVTVTRGALLVVADTGNFRVRQIGPYPLPAEPGGTRGGPKPPTGQRPPITAPPGHQKHRQLLRPPTVSHITIHRDGTITLSVTVHGPGTIDVLVTAWNDNLARASARLQPAPGRFVFARRHTTAPRARTLRLTIRPNKRGTRLVHHHTYRVTLRLWVSYTPTGGRPRSIGFHGLHIPK